MLKNMIALAVIVIMTSSIGLAQQGSCQAKCVLLQSGPKTMEKIKSVQSSSKTDMIQLKDFGMVNGDSLEQLQERCNLLTSNYLNSMHRSTWPNEDFIAVKLADQITVDQTDSLKAVIHWTEKSACVPAS